MNKTIAGLLVSCTLLASSFTLIPNVLANTDKQVRFVADDGGKIVHNNNLREELLRTVDTNTLLKDIVPEVKANESYKFRGWFTYQSNKGTEKVTITDTLKVDTNKDYHASFYKDINDNNIDDTTEKITLKFVPNNEEQINDAKLHVGQSFELPTLNKKEGHVLAGWYLDKDFKTKYNENNPLQKDTTLYAKWQKEETNKDDTLTNSIVQKIKELFESRFTSLEEGLKETNEKVSSLSTQPIVISPTQTVEQPPTQTAGQSQGIAQSSSTDQSQPTSSNSGATATTGTQTARQSQVLTYTEPTYVYNNASIGQKFVVKFYNENDKLLYMLELPYGHTIRTLNQDDKLIKEYSVRQDTKIIMATKDYMSDVVEEMLEIESRVIEENSSQITEVYPTEVIQIDKSVLTDMKQEEQQTEEANLNASIWMIVGILSAIFIVALAIILLMKKRKRKQKDNEENDINIDSTQETEENQKNQNEKEVM